MRKKKHSSSFKAFISWYDKTVIPTNDDSYMSETPYSYNFNELLADVDSWQGNPSHLAIIAGEGTLPLQAVKDAKRQGYKVYVFVIGGNWREMARYKPFADVVEAYHLGQLRRMMNVFRSHQIKYVCFAGKVNKWLLFTQLNLDSLSLRLLQKMPRKNDDAVMHYIIEGFADLGMETLPQVKFMQALFQPEGILAEGHPLTETDWLGICFGFDTAKAMAALDVGQTVVVNETMVIAIEAIEGTDECLKRAGKLQRKQGGIVAKVAKPFQDDRFDVPAVGLRTLKTMRDNGLNILVTEAGSTLFLDSFDRMKAYAESNHLTLLSVSEAGLQMWRERLAQRQTKTNATLSPASLEDATCEKGSTYVYE
jgi:DUF1009 family protein